MAGYRGSIYQLPVKLIPVISGCEWEHVYTNQYMHCVEGPIMCFTINRAESYWLNNQWFSDKTDYYQQPEVKRYMLLKALKDLK